MNPTSKNIAYDTSWEGIRVPCIGTKNIWNLFEAINMFDIDIYKEIKNKKAKDRNKKFAESVYNE